MQIQYKYAYLCPTELLIIIYRLILKAMATLDLKFSSEYSFEKAKIHFDEVSNFCPDEINEEFRCFSFNVSDEDEAESLESYIDSELNQTAYITNYHFDYEN